MEDDAEFQQEQGRYADPIPSRAHILKTLGEQPGPVTLDDLVGLFGLRKLSQQEALNKRLVAMSREGQVVQNRNGAYGPVAQMNLIAGCVQAHRDGFGFLIPDAGGPDVFLPPRQMRALMNGDRVLVRITGTDFKGRPEGAVSEVIERVSRTIVGRFHMDQGISYVIPDNPRITQDLLIPPEGRKGAKNGQMVVADIVTPPGNRTLAVGEVKEILGQHLAPGMEIEAAIRAHSLPFEFPDAVERESAAIPDTVQPAQMAGREDIRDLPLVTIDGADARDFDDAVYAKPIKKSLLNKGGWTLWVAIADVSAYVRPDTPLDKEASKRATSVYFPQRVIPMLPEKLSNGLCSLNPDVDRLCMVCEMRVMPDGEVAKSRFFEGVMRSKARMIYEDVAEILDQPDGEKARARSALVPHLQALDGVFEALFKARERRGAIDFESTETKIVFSGERKIDRIVPVQRNRAHRLIEECMIAANVESAKTVQKAKVPTLYRIHEQPDTMKVTALREFLALQALKLGGGEKPAAMDFAKALAAAKGRPDQMLVQTIMLRSLMQAKYNPTNSGHFGLALTHYAHFTSPIRRYPDLLLHRGLKHILLKKKGQPFLYTPEQMEAFGTHCSMAERRADEATRDVNTWLKCEYMRHRVGEDFDGTVSSVAAFGLFVELTGLYVDGLVHVSNLKNDYYEYDNRSHRLVGKASRMTYTLGTKVRVKVVRVDLDERKIDLELLSSGKGQPGPGKGQGGQGKGQRSQDRRSEPKHSEPRHSEPVKPRGSESHPSKSHSRRGKR
ncbi:ribonuclease R [Solimonas sp. K1W22B-7]|uniref:ribonuclease R n=1 Tax=Solimonas sp. K1W22B-7 TaxID=2303331 RepID=UPI000E32F4CD|nr:ribonuclease R [Solimonas sp. K1W22B-7]AXQ29678.1 ribonuclease R [Solimonas sp. K1W22B-7]